MQHNEIKKFVPEEIWWFIFSYLPNTDKFNTRSVSKSFKQLVESSPEWQDDEVLKNYLVLIQNKTSSRKVLNVPEFVARNLVLEYLNKMNSGISESQYRDMMEELVKLNKVLTISPQTCANLEKATENFRADWLKRSLWKDPCGLIGLNGVLMFLSVAASTWLMLTVLLPGDRPADIAAKSECDMLDPWDNTCKDHLAQALNQTFAMFFAIGGSFGFLIKMLEHCLDSIRRLDYSAELPTPNSVLVPSFKEGCRSFIKQAFKYKHSIAFSVGSVLTGLTAGFYKPLQLNLNDYAYQYSSDPDLAWLDQDRLVEDLEKRTELLAELTIPNAFLLVYSFMHFCALTYGVSKTLLAECDRFYKRGPYYQTDHNSINEQTHLFAPDNNV